ncbi:polysaccharide deacetylase family protein [Azospirillum sp.]|uniref:polysaccharide deacetylase family protein n=1 Tax=Azospirillum sp. TaxID=34012 RepID=UPI003D7405D9
MGRILAALLLFFLAVVPAAAQTVPRTVLALYDGREEPKIKQSRIHSMVEMPLNHLGLTVAYWDVANGLPDPGAYPDLRGVVTWFASEPFEDPAAYVAWLGTLTERGVRVAVLGQYGVRAARGGKAMPMALVNRFLRVFGLFDDEGYSDLTYRSRPVVQDSALVGFERRLDGVLPGYPRLRLVDGRFTSHLVMRRADDPATDSHLIVTGPSGGLVTEGYARFFDPESLRKRWIIDPFAFFRLAFATDDLPKPDVTTLSGRRLYFSHIDGDGWRNVTEVKPYADQSRLAAEVVLKEAIEAHPDLPVTVAPIVGDLDAAWKGTPQALAVAKRLFALPQVEPASHTWTHPFFWGFFKDYDPAREEEFRDRAPARKGGFLARFRKGGTDDHYENVGEVAESAPGADIGRYAVPRAFLQTPFDLRQEIGGSLEYFSRLAPEGKTARLIQWPGDTTPFEAAVVETRRAGARNMNGGDTRYDPEYPSLTSVSPIGVPVGAERQIYSATSNENTYTDLWSSRFFGFQNLVHTVRGTETPVRLKPFNIYYHMYSGQKLASVNALKKNLAFAEAAELAPVTATAYAAIADGFYTARLVAEGPGRWRVMDRGDLATLRFDRAVFRGVDFARSVGVIGQRHHQGSLYVALDPAVAEPVVALADIDRADTDPAASRPYLVHGRWALAGLSVDGGGFTVRAQGFGPGAMAWRVPGPSRWTVSAERDGRALWQGAAEAGTDGRLTVTVAAGAETPLTLRFVREGR